jgi:Glycosyl transferase family 2
MSTVSILTPTLPDREWFFNRCKRSVQYQTYPLIEHVIVRDKGIGPMAAFQRCLDQATCEYVMALGDDDWLAPHAVETLVPYLEVNDIVFGRTLIVSPGKDRLVSGHAAMWKKALTDEIGGYDPHYRHAGDSELFGRLIDHGASFAYCPEPLYFFTEHATHNSYVHREALKVELEEIKALHEDAHRKLASVVPV